MRRARSPEAGMTLVEIMIAVTLVALLSVGMMMALRIGLNAMLSSNTKLMANRRIAGTGQIVEQEFAGLMPVTAMHHNISGATQPVLFIQGEPQAMRFVTTYSLKEASRGNPQNFERFVLPGQKEGVRLVMNEVPYTGPDSAGQFSLGLLPDASTGALVPRFIGIEARASSFILADRLAYCHFAYQEKVPPPDGALWREQWIHQVWPVAVRIEMASLDTDPGHLQMTSLTLPVRVKRDQDRVYTDDF